MDRSSDRSVAGVLMGFSLYDDGGPDVGLRTDLYGQYVSRGVGGFVALPIAYASGNDESETAIGNLELGLLYTPKTPKQGLPVTLRASLMLGTADDDLVGGLTNFFTSFGRLTDLASSFPETTSLRLSASPVIRNGQFFGRADIGLDVAVSTPDNQDLDPLLRINLGAGMLVGPTAVLMAELVTLGTTGEVGDNQDRFLSTAAISARFYAGNVEPVASIVIPLDDELDGVTAILMAGVQVALP